MKSTTGDSGRKAFLDGHMYLFSVKRETHDGIKYRWVCSTRNCMAAITTDSDGNILIPLKRDHFHAPPGNIIKMAESARGQMRILAKERPELSAGAVINEAKGNYPDAVVDGLPEYIKNTIIYFFIIRCL
uniref:FLYWCH-type domain-containing protein n=1 Tax=Acrobeloides nanus TaxID=290746 RepID=A0A914CER9_9BILA